MSLHRRAASRALNADEDELQALLAPEKQDTDTSPSKPLPPASAPKAKDARKRLSQSKLAKSSLIVALVILVALSLSRLEPLASKHLTATHNTEPSHPPAAEPEPSAAPSLEEQAQQAVESAAPVDPIPPPSLVSHRKPKTKLRVGPREMPALYAGQGCNSTQLLAAYAAATIRPDGISRKEFNWTSNKLPQKQFEFSYDLEGCAQPHVFSASQACDLLNAFGGVYIRGDSLMRHISEAFWVLLNQSFDIQWSRKELCSGNRLWTDKKCRFHAKFDSRELEFASQFCSNERGVAPVRYQQLYSWRPEHHPSLEDPLVPYRKRAVELAKRALPTVQELSTLLQGAYKDFIASLDGQRRKLSPVYIHGTGLHYYWSTNISWKYHIQPWLKTAASSSPRPLALWALNPAPGLNKPQQFVGGQGAKPTKKYNAKMRELLDQANKEAHTADPAHCAWLAFDSYGVTDGASSYDGTHYSYQVNTERVQMLLNYLDLVWGEIVDLGGLVEL